MLGLLMLYFVKKKKLHFLNDAMFSAIELSLLCKAVLYRCSNQASDTPFQVPEELLQEIRASESTLTEEDLILLQSVHRWKRLPPSAGFSDLRGNKGCHLDVLLSPTQQSFFWNVAPCYESLQFLVKYRVDPGIWHESCQLNRLFSCFRLSLQETAVNVLMWWKRLDQGLDQGRANRGPRAACGSISGKYPNLNFPPKYHDKC